MNEQTFHLLFHWSKMTFQNIVKSTNENVKDVILNQWICSKMTYDLHENLIKRLKSRKDTLNGKIRDEQV